VRRRDLLLGGSLTALAAADALGQPVPFSAGVFKKTLGPNGGSLGPVTGGASPAIDLNFITSAASFTGGSALDSRVTFSRADTVAAASYTDSTGLLRYGPTNRLFPSGNMASVWTLGNTTITAAAGTAPDGTNSMNRLVDTATTAVHQISKNSTVVAATIYTFSIYAQAAENRYLQLVYDDGSANGAYATFDLTGGIITGVVVARGLATNIGASMTSVGNSIYRCSVTCAHNNGVSGRSVALTVLSGSPGYAPSYAGNASNGMLLWGAQLEENTAPTQYVATTGAALSGPRFDYSPATVTNFIRNNSMAGANATGNVFPTFWLHGENTTLTPTIVGVGTETGIPYVDIQISGAATSGNNNIFFDAPAAIQALTGQTWTHSVYLRIVGGSTTNLNQVYVSMQMRDSAGSGLGSFTSNVLASLNGNALAGNRFTLTSALNNASTAFVQPWIQINPQSAAINITLRIGAPQLEQAASANTFVPTYGTFAGSGGTLNGLLIEEARTNLAFPSATVATLFTASATTLTATQGAAPDGTLTMVRLAEDATSATHYAFKTFTVTASGVYTFSIYALAQQNTFLQLFYDDSTAVNGCYVNFNLTTGVISQAIAAFGAGTATRASITAVGNGIYRCSVTGVATTSTTGRIGVVLAQVGNAGFATSYAGTVTNGLLIWGAQFELGAFPTSYIPTVSASQAKTADVVNVPTAGWFNASAGAMVAETTNLVTQLGNIRLVGTTSLVAPLQISPGAGQASTFNGTVTINGGAGQTVSARVAWGVTYSAAGRSVCALGGALGSDANTIGAVSAIYLGSASSGTSNFLNGAMRRFRGWSQPLLGTQLQAATL
jgi:hypothetical protein